MSVRPLRLDRVATDVGDAFELKRLCAEGLLWPDIQVAHHILLAFAPGARTSATQFFQRNKTLRVVIPFDRELRSNLLKVNRPHGANVNCRTPARPRWNSLHPRTYNETGNNLSPHTAMALVKLAARAVSDISS